jgi:hypothetical protein
MSRYLSQTLRELLDAQESDETGAHQDQAVLAAAIAWKRARRLLDEHVMEHGSCPRRTASAKPPETQAVTVLRLRRIVSLIRFWSKVRP